MEGYVLLMKRAKIEARQCCVPLVDRTQKMKAFFEQPIKEHCMWATCAICAWSIILVLRCHEIGLENSFCVTIFPQFTQRRTLTSDSSFTIAGLQESFTAQKYTLGCCWCGGVV